MTDEETVEAILDKAHDKCELTASHDVPYLRATLLDLVRAARQPVAHEVPGFHLASGGGVAAWTATYARWSDIQPEDFRTFDIRRVMCEETGLVVRTKGAEHDDR